MWFWFSLLSAAISATSIIFNKKALKNVSAPLLTWALFALSIPILFFLSFKDGLPQINNPFLIAVLGAAGFFAVAKTLTLEAIKKGLLSRIYPLTAFSSVFTYFIGLILLSESLNLTALIGLFSVIGGAYIINAEGAKGNLLKPFKSLFTNYASLVFLLAMFLKSFASILEKTSLVNTVPLNPYLVALVENTIIVFLLTGYLNYKGKGWLVPLKQNFWQLFLASLIYASLAVVVLMGYSGGPVVLVSGIKKLQIIFVLFLSWLFFGDKPTRHIWSGALLMLVGIVLIKIA